MDLWVSPHRRDLKARKVPSLHFSILLRSGRQRKQMKWIVVAKDANESKYTSTKDTLMKRTPWLTICLSQNISVNLWINKMRYSVMGFFSAFTSLLQDIRAAITARRKCFDPQPITNPGTNKQLQCGQWNWPWWALNSSLEKWG